MHGLRKRFSQAASVLVIIGACASSAAYAEPPVLATAAQCEREAMALRALASPPVHAAVTRIQQAYSADPQGSTPAGQATIGRASRSIAMAAAQYVVNNDPARPVAMWAVNAPHAWCGLDVPRSGYGIDNPDNVYRNIPIDGATHYEIHGRITHPGPVELHFALMDSIPGTTPITAEGGGVLAALRSDQIKTAPDGTFTISVDSLPAGDRSNHIQTPRDGRYLLIVRDLFTDWGTQNPVELEIRRLGSDPLPPSPSDDQLAMETASLLDKIAPYWVAYDNRFIFSRPANQAGQPRSRPGGRGLSTSGHFNLARDEALVITLNPLGAVSLGIQLTDPWGVAYDYIDRTSSLNTVQARPNRDGTCTYVISPVDPGVHNWLDPEGHGTGIFAVRWQSLPSGVVNENAVVGTQVVKIRDLKRALPAETVFVSPAERRQQQAERARSYARRLGALPDSPSSGKRQ